MGEIVKIKVGHNGKGSGSEWQLDKIEIRRVANEGRETVEELMTFYFNGKVIRKGKQYEGKKLHHLSPAYKKSSLRPDRRPTKFQNGRESRSKSQQCQIFQKMNPSKKLMKKILKIIESHYKMHPAANLSVKFRFKLDCLFIKKKLILLTSKTNFTIIFV